MGKTKTGTNSSSKLSWNPLSYIISFSLLFVCPTGTCFLLLLFLCGGIWLSLFNNSVNLALLIPSLYHLRQLVAVFLTNFYHFSYVNFLSPFSNDLLVQCSFSLCYCVAFNNALLATACPYHVSEYLVLVLIFCYKQISKCARNDSAISYAIS